MYVAYVSFSCSKIPDSPTRAGSESGVPLGYIAEEPRGFLGTISRQILATHRPFTAVVMDQQGMPILWVSSCTEINEGEYSQY